MVSKLRVTTMCSIELKSDDSCVMFDTLRLRNQCKCKLSYDHVKSNHKVILIDISDDIQVVVYGFRKQACCKCFRIYHQEAMIIDAFVQKCVSDLPVIIIFGRLKQH